MTSAATITDSLLKDVHARFYAGDIRRFHRDRRHLLKALTWPAAWLAERGLSNPGLLTSADYHQLILDRLDAIQRHGRWQSTPFFPTYFLKCLQDHFAHHGDELYARLKHLRTSLDCALSTILKLSSMKSPPEPLVNILASAHNLLRHPAKKSPRPNPTTSQPSLL